MTQKNLRLDWVDISRGIAITLMVLGHSSLPTPIQSFIYSFHMPFFFFISGMLSKQFSNLTSNAFISFAKKKAIALLLPFVIYSIINIILYPLYGKLTIFEYILQVIQQGWGGLALWFIPVFFISVIISKFCITTKRTAIISAILLIIISYLLATYKIILPWNISTVPIASAFMIIGYLMKDIVFSIVNTVNYIKCTYIILLTMSVSFVIALHFRLDMATYKITPIIPIIIAALSGIFFLLTVSSIISRFNILSKTIQYIGRHTYEILGFSQVIIMIINRNTSIGVILKYIILIIILYCIFRLRDSIPKLFINRG